MNDELKKINVFLIEDNDDDAYLINDTIGDMFNINRVRDGFEGFQYLKTIKEKPDVVLVDFRLPEMTAIEIIEAINKEGIELAFIVITTDMRIETAIKSMKAGALDFLPKAAGYDALSDMIMKVYQIHQDRIEKREMEKELRENQKKLAELNANKDKFFSIIAHDLKTPLFSFQSFFSLIIDNLDAMDKAKIKDMMHKLSENFDSMFSLLDNLLTWSRVQRNKIDVNYEILDVKNLVSANILLIESSAKEKNITIKTDTEPHILYTDKFMLDTIIRNILTNALKFTRPGGTIEITTKHKNQRCSVVIKDSGIGIPEEALSELFSIQSKNQRLGTSNERGTGLGLILCKEFIDKLGGTIKVDSEVDKGSTFCITLNEKKTSEDSESSVWI